MKKWETALTKRLNIQFPIVLAPMARISGGKLAAAVSEAGGVGIVGGGYGDEKSLSIELEIVANGTNHPWGVGFITWSLSLKSFLLDIALEYDPHILFLSFGDIRPFASKIKKAGKLLVCQVQNIDDALIARDEGADFIVAQGMEAGGHSTNDQGTFCIVPSIVDAVAPTPVLAAGGVCDGRGLAAALMLGADGVVMGSRFYASVESSGDTEAKSRMIRGKGSDTIRTPTFDIARGLNWPAPYNARALKNEFTECWHSRVEEMQLQLNEVQVLYQNAQTTNDFNTAAVFAGQGIDRIHSIQNAKEAVDNVILEAKSILDKKFWS
ncbi:NAD(P)H-dependent flavin oxidoreductase [Paenibacillus andongensis]|uniref:NAD(P)H-dependent flavin oxidoreductase n=1 Tax=Paenibacillus andongensis TaxID=2975482 RepID=UPI0021BB3C97|nr:nitronate monooxygenase [Paenibacillus andongensis]